jgi:membrane associated rhomboid family serine protease
MRRYASKIGPSHTPKIIKYLISITAIVSFVCMAFAPFFEKTSLYAIFSLSYYGIQQGYLWQIITYLFVIPSMQFDFNFILHIVFNLYLLWIFGTSYIQYRSVKRFVLLYFISGIAAGLLGIGMMALFSPSYVLAGNMLPLFALLTAWIRFNPKATFHILHSIPLKATWIVIGIIGLNLLIDVSRYDYVSFIATLTSIGIGYLFSLIPAKSRP